MDLIRINMEKSLPRNEVCQMLCTQLDWLKVENEGYYDSLEVYDNQNKEVSKLGQEKIDYVIGSDIVYWTNSIKPLMNVLKVIQQS